MSPIGIENCWSAIDFAAMSLVAVFGKNVRSARRSAGWTQEQLAFEAGVKRGYISEVEAGKRNASLDIVEKLAKALKVEPGELMMKSKGAK